MASNEALLMQILKDNRDTEYGKKYGFAGIRSIREYFCLGQQHERSEIRSAHRQLLL